MDNISFGDSTAIEDNRPEASFLDTSKSLSEDEIANLTILIHEDYNSLLNNIKLLYSNKYTKEVSDILTTLHSINIKKL